MDDPDVRADAYTEDPDTGVDDPDARVGESDARDETRAPTIRDGGPSKVAEWVLLTGDRGIVALGIAAAFGVFFTALVSSAAVPLSDTQALFYAYSGLIAGNLTLITVIVSINQLLLSRELGTPGEVRSQIEHVLEYRSEIEDVTGEIAPVRPADFLLMLVEETREEAQDLGGVARGEEGGEAAGREEIIDVVETLTEQMDRIERLLRGSDAGIFKALSVMFETNYAQQFNELRRIRKEHGSDLEDVVHESIDGVLDRVREIDVSRQYFKSIYIERELSSFSRILMYAGLPAEAVAVAALLVLTVPTEQPDATVSLSVFLPVTLTVALLPLAILCSFILRTATVTRLTATTLPFTTSARDR